jgi:hypothetical protein
MIRARDIVGDTGTCILSIDWVLEDEERMLAWRDEDASKVALEKGARS